VVLYAIFVDSKYTNPWTKYDIYSTLDSIKVATRWIEDKARENGIKLNITVEYYKDNKQVIPIESNLSKRSLAATLFAVNGVKYIDRWADKIAYIALQTYGQDTTSITKTKIKPKNRERLIAKLRDLYKTDNVALIYLINNYYTDEISLALHTASDNNPEYSVVSFKQPTVISHEFLHIFGALDLYITPFDNKKQIAKQKTFAMKEFPNEIMAFPYRSLDSLEISPLTKYLLGWDNQLDEHYKQMIFGKKIKIAKY
jgi:hypothetical protein